MLALFTKELETRHSAIEDLMGGRTMQEVGQLKAYSFSRKIHVMNKQSCLIVL